MHYSVPRLLFEKLKENLGDTIAAEKFASSIEDAVDEISKNADRQTVEKLSVIKMEIKEDLTKILVTREIFEEKFESQNLYINQKFQSMQEQMNQRFQAIQEQMDQRFQAMQEQMNQRFQALQEQMDQRFQAMQEQMDQRFQALRDYMDLRFKQIDFKFNVLIGISLFGFTLFNPGFLDLIKSLMK